MKKTIYTLNIGGHYNDELTSITYPFIKAWAFKIKADFYEITEKKFPDFPARYEKLQVYELGKEHKNDWNIFTDCDALVHPDMIDVTGYLNKDTLRGWMHGPHGRPRPSSVTPGSIAGRSLNCSAARISRPGSSGSG